MLKQHPKWKRFLVLVLDIVIFVPVYLFLNAVIFGVDAGDRLPPLEDIVQVEIWSSDAQKARLESRTFGKSVDIAVARAMLAEECDYGVFQPLNAEDIPRLTVRMTLTDASEYTVVVGNTTVSFNGTFRTLRDDDAAQVLTRELLEEYGE